MGLLNIKQEDECIYKKTISNITITGASEEEYVETEKIRSKDDVRTIFSKLNNKPFNDMFQIYTGITLRDTTKINNLEDLEKYLFK